MKKKSDPQADRDKEWQQRELIRWLKVYASDIDLDFQVLEQAVAHDAHNPTPGRRPLSWMDVQICYSYLRENCSKERTREILESEDLREVRDRIRILSAMKDPRKFFYSAEQVAAILPQFISHLEENRASIVETGYPRTRFTTALWLDWRLTDLYRTKLPLRVDVKKDSRGIPAYSYFWAPVKQNHPLVPYRDHGSPLALNMPSSYQLLPGSKEILGNRTPPFSMPKTKLKPSKRYLEQYEQWQMDLIDDEPEHSFQEDLFEHEDPDHDPVPYAVSPPMDGITFHLDSQIEHLRSTFFKIRIEVLRRLCHAMSGGDVETLMKSCLEPLKKGLTISEASLMLKLDFPKYLDHYTSFLCPDYRHIGPIAGGFTSLLRVIRDCMCEVASKTNSSTHRKLGGLLRIDRDGTKHVQLSTDWLTTGEKRIIDKAEVVMTDRGQDHAAINDLFGRIVRNWLKDDFIAEIPVKVVGSAESVKKIRNVLLNGAPLRELPGGEKGTILKDLDRPPRPGENIFALRGQKWVMYYNDKLTLMDDYLGFQYLSVLLRRPCEEKTCIQLQQAVNGVPVGDHNDDLDARVKKDFAGGATVGLSHQALVEGASLAKTKEQMRELREDIEEANADNDPSRAEEARQKLDALLKLFRVKRVKAFPIKQSEQLRKNVRKAINKAMMVLKDKNKPLYTHLKLYIHTGNSCRYTPEPLVKWTTT